MSGHSWARWGDFACVLRSRITASQYRVKWIGVTSYENLDTPSGDAAFSLESDWYAAATRAIFATIDRQVSPLAKPLTLSVLTIEPEREKAWFSGGLTNAETNLFFTAGQFAVLNKSAISAVVNVHGGCFLVRVLRSGIVEAIPFSIDADGIREDLTIGKYDRNAYWTSQALGAGYTVPMTGTIIADLVNLRPWEICLAADPLSAWQPISDLLLGPVNDQIGGAIEPVQSVGHDQLNQSETPGTFRDAAAVTALMAQDFENLSYSQPLDSNGVSRLLRVKCQNPRTEDIATALFNAATNTEPAKRVVASFGNEPPWPWNPRQPKTHHINRPALTGHEMVMAVNRMAQQWRRIRGDESQAWRLCRGNGKQLPPDVLAEIDARLCRSEQDP